MFTGLIAVISVGVHDIGGYWCNFKKKKPIILVFITIGFTKLWEINSQGGRLNFFDFDPNIFIRQSFWPLIFGMIVHFSMSYCLDQR